ALALPSERAATIALRTQQVIANESGVASTSDPAGGSYFVEALTRELEERAWELIGEVDERGGAGAAIEAGWRGGQGEASHARGSENLLRPIREALRVRCTVGEVCGTLRDEWGTYDR